MEVASITPTDGQQLLSRLRGLTNEANGGDERALSELRTLLADSPALVDHFGDLTKYVESTWIDVLASGNALVKESVREHLAQLRATLAGSQSTAIEQLLVNQVVINLLADRHATISEASSVGGTPQLVTMRAKRAESTHKRLLGSIKLLTTLRAFAPAGLEPIKTKPKPPELKHSA